MPRYEEPTIYVLCKTERPGQRDTYEYITRATATTRGLLRQALSSEAGEYVRIGPATYQLLRDWRAENRIGKAKRPFGS